MKHPCVTFWPEKFFADTSHVSPSAAAFYMVLLMQAWTRGGSLPNDHAVLRNMTRLNRQRWQEIRDEILPFWFVGEDGRLHQKRLDKEWQRAEKRRPVEPMSDNGHSLKTLDKTPSRVSGKNAKNADTLEAQNTNEINGDPIPPRTRARPLPLPRNSLSAEEQRETVSRAAQSLSQPAAALSVGHAAQPAPNTNPTPTNGAEPMPDQAAIDRVTAAMARLKADLADKNLAAFERPTLEGPPAAQGATSEERDRNAAIAHLEKLKGQQLPPISPAAKAAAGIPEREKTWKTKE